MLIKNAFILRENFKFERGNIEFDRTISNFASNFALETIDAQGMLLVPGLIDVHTHGAMGFDMGAPNAAAYQAMGEYYAEHGVTSFMLATMSMPKEQLRESLQTVANLMDEPHGAAYPHGIYLEGAFISGDKCGAHRAEFLLEPDRDLLEQLLAAAKGYIKVVAVAPELKRALPFIEAAAKDVVVTLGHTEADYELTGKAIELGATNATHLFNAMSPLSARNPGVIGAVIDNEKVFVEVIADGVHLHKSIIRLAFKVCGENRMILISDSVPTVGLGAGTYNVGGCEILAAADCARGADGTLLGSTLSLLDCVRKCREIGIPLEQAIKAASLNPARMLGVDKVTGSIGIGKAADLVLLDRDLNVRMVFVKGRKVFSSQA